MGIRHEVIWFLAGLLLMIIEFALPRAVLVFFGLGAWIAGLATYLGLTRSPLWQAVLFAAASSAMLLGLRGLVRKRLLLPEEEEDATGPRETD